MNISLPVVRLWIVLSTILCAGGWVLSFFRALNSWGYVVLGLIFAGIIFFRKELGLGTLPRIGVMCARVRRRMRKPAPLCFIILSFMALAGGLIYESLFHDTLSYRIPRLLHWLDESHWHWIKTGDLRMNVVSTGIEWLWAPLVLIFKTDRPLFLVSWFSLLLLPGLFFRFLRLAGVSSKVAYWWMWLLPTGYCYLLQAGSLAADNYATVYSLASVVFALEAARTRRVSDLWISILAVGLLVGSRQTNMPLALVWLVAALPALGLLWRRWESLLICFFAALSSFIPITIANILYAGSWKGFPTSATREPDSAFWGIVGNTFAITAQNLIPPLFPWAKQWNAAMASFVDSEAGRHFRSFESFGFLERSPTESMCGLGLGLSVLLIATLIYMVTVKGPVAPMKHGVNWPRRLLVAASWVTVMVFMAKVSIAYNARYLATYYPFLLLLPLLSRKQPQIVRRILWQRLAIGGMCLAIGLMVFSRQRPLFPVMSTISLLEKWRPNNPGLNAVRDLYGFGPTTLSGYAALVSHIPSEEKVVGYVASVMRGGAKDVALSRPFGSRRIVRILPTDTHAEILALGIRYVLIDEYAIGEEPFMTIDDWLARYPGHVVYRHIIRFRPSDPPTESFVVRLNAPEPAIR